MKRKYAIFGSVNEYLFDVLAKSEEEALASAKEINSTAARAMIVCPGNDLGVYGIN